MVSVLLVVLIASGFVTFGDTQGVSYGRDWDLLIKAAENVRYPRDSIWKRIQQRIPVSEPFPCSEKIGELRWRSATRPDSVHQLLPGDIDVIGAIGDSLTAGSGAREFNPIGVTIQDRGVSFTGGGQGTWREYITLPNILKVFNPNLRGYSIGVGDAGSTNAQLNVAVPAAMDDDVLQQAKAFVSGMLRDPKINITSDWKMLSIFIGQNDICSCYCYNKQAHSPEAHKRNLQKALDYLYQKVPRLYINLLPVIDATILARMKRTGFCEFIERISCSCVYRGRDLKKGLLDYAKVAQKYQDAEKELAFSERYRDRKDFTIEWQPFFQFTNLQTLNSRSETALIEGLRSYPIWSPDCFHFNQRGFAICSLLLWNNIMQPVGNKSVTYPEKGITHRDIICPTPEAPYIFTKENSNRKPL